MARSGGRLTLTDAMNRNMSSRLNPLTDNCITEPHSGSKHASVCRLERELKAVKEENHRLKSQLEDTRDALKEITVEASMEKFDERRVNLLKLQIFQLQRQVVLMTEALGSRSTILMEVENALTWLSTKIRHYVGLDVRGPEVPVARADLMSMVDTCESARIKLFKGIENCSRDSTTRHPMFHNPFLKAGLEKEFSVLDCCLGRPDCLNLKHVAQLESKLSVLYKELVKVSEGIAVVRGGGGGKAGSHMTSTVHDRDEVVLLRACAMARDCASQLLSLSLLVPAAPWPPLKTPIIKEVTLDALVESLPPLPRTKAAQVQQCMMAALKVCNHRAHMASVEAGALREEVRFHQAVYQLQLDYILQAFDALRDGYEEFEKSANEVLIQPMKKLMQAYDSLKKKNNEQGLKTFLTVVKEHHSQWEDAIQKLDTSSPQHESGSSRLHRAMSGPLLWILDYTAIDIQNLLGKGSVSLSVFAHDFVNSLDCLVLTRQTQRDKATSQKEELKVWQQQLEEELRAMISSNHHNQGGDHDPTNNVHEPISNHHHSNDPHTPPYLPEACPRMETDRSLDPDFHPSPAQTKKEKKKSRKPWMGVGDDSSQTSGRKNTSGESRGEGIREADNDVGFSLRSWLNEPAYSESGERKPDWVSGSEHQEEGGGPPSSNKMGTLGKKGGQWGDSDTQPHTHRSTNYPQADAASSEPHGSSPSVLNSQRSLLHYNTHSPFHSARSSSTDTPDWDKPMGDESHQQGTTSSHYKAGLPDIPSTSHKPFLPAESGSKPPPAGPNKGKGRAAPRTYQPKLYVANKTLTLRRSGSLSKLSEPSLEERMMKGESSSRDKRDNSSSRQSSR